MGIDSLPPDITLEDIKKGHLKPTILQVYPTSPTESNEVPLYLTNLNQWVFPDGFKILNENNETIYSTENNEKYVINNDNTPTTSIKEHGAIHSFMITDEKYNRRYCSALLFHELFSLHNDEGASSPTSNHCLYIPKAFILVSDTSCLDAHRQFLRYFYKTFVPKKQNNSPLQHEKCIKIPSKYVQHVHSLLRPGLESLLLYEDNHITHTQHEPESLSPIVRESQLREFYISAVYSLFPQIIAGQEVKERVLLAPLENGKADKEELVRYRVQNLSGIDIPSTNFKPLFKRLSARNIVRVVKGIFLERQLIFFSSRPKEIPYITEALLSLLSPMKWRCIYIPYLPISIWETLHAVMPYIVGVAAKYKEFIAMHIDLTDKVVVDLDNDALYIGEDSYDFPKRPRDFIIERIEQISKGPHTLASRKSPDFWAELALKAKHHFRVFFIMMMNNYISFFKFPKIPAKGPLSMPASEVFDFESYFACLVEDHRDFMEEAQNTMIYTNFLEETFEVLQSRRSHTSTSSRTQEEYQEHSIFIEQLNQIIQIFDVSKQTLKKKYCMLDLSNTRVISYIDMVHASWVREAMNHFIVPEKIDLLPYLAKYYCEYPKDFESDSTAYNICADAEKAKARASKDEKNRFRPLDKEKLNELNKLFSSAGSNSGTSYYSSPSISSIRRPASTPVHNMEEYFEQGNAKDSSFHMNHLHSQGELDEHPSFLSGSKWYINTPKTSKEPSFEDRNAGRVHQELRRVYSSHENTRNALQRDSPGLEYFNTSQSVIGESRRRIFGKQMERENSLELIDIQIKNGLRDSDGGKKEGSLVEGTCMAQLKKGVSMPEMKNRTFIQSIPVPDDKENMMQGRKKKPIFGTRSVLGEDKVLKNSENILNNMMNAKLPPLGNSARPIKPMNRSVSYQVKESNSLDTSGSLAEIKSEYKNRSSNLVEMVTSIEWRRMNSERRDGARPFEKILEKKRDEGFMVARNLDTGELVKVEEMQGPGVVKRQSSLRK